jgi:hypothetical protein
VGKVNLVIVDVPNSLLDLLASNFMVLGWNKKVDNSIEAMMFFSNRFLIHNGVAFIFDVYHMHTLKEILSFFDSYKFKPNE